MTASITLGLVGDILTFGGGLLLSVDALQRGRDLKKTAALQEAVAKLSGIKLTMGGLSIFDNDSTELVLIQKSVRRAMWGTVIITSGFLCLLASKIIEMLKP